MQFLRSLFGKKDAATTVAAQSSTPSPVVVPPQAVDPRRCGLMDAVQSGWYQNSTDELFKGFPINADDVVLDVGCGGGGATLFCANRGAHVVFTDAIPEKVDLVREKIQKTRARKIEGLVSDSCPLPLDDAYASKIILLEVLEHVEDPAQLLAELVRVAKPGAQFLLAVPDAQGERMQMALAPSSYFSSPNHIHVFERDQFAQLVEAAGLIIEKQDSYGFYWLMWMMIYWTTAKASGTEQRLETHDVVHPPYPPLLQEWTTLWHALISMPESAEMKKALDSVVPKSQIIIARKPIAS